MTNPEYERPRAKRRETQFVFVSPLALQCIIATMIYHDENEGSSIGLQLPTRTNKPRSVLRKSSRKIVNSNLNAVESCSLSKATDDPKKEKIQFPTVPDPFVQRAKQLQRNVRENPQQSSPWWLLVHFYSAKCKLDASQMLDVCEKACSLISNDNSDHVYAKLHLAQCKYLCQCHRRKEALRLYKAMDMNGIGRELYYFWIGYAATLVKDNKKQTAIQLLRKCLVRFSSSKDQAKIKTYLKDLECAKSPVSDSTPSKPHTGITETPQSKLGVVSTPLNSCNSFDAQISTPACLIEGTRPSPPCTTPAVADNIENDSKVPQIHKPSKELSIESNSQAATPLSQEKAEKSLSRSPEISPCPVITTIEEDVVFDDSEHAEMKPKEEHAPKMKEFVVNHKKYWKLSVMGQGGTSRVIKALGWIGSGSKKRMEVFAIKQVKLEGEELHNSALKNEIEYLLSLQGQRNIVHLYDHEITSKHLFLVLELGDIDLRVLLKRLAPQTRRINAIRVYWQQMLEAVAVIHSKRIVHTDLKPANFVSFNGCLKLIDFGIAGAIQANTVNIKRDTMVC